MDDQIGITENKEIIIFPGEKYPLNIDLITSGNFSFISEQKLINSKRFISIEKDKNNKIESYSIVYGNYYKPQVEDFVIGTIISKSAEHYKVDINTYSPALLGSMEFQGATKTSKPILKVGDLIYSKIIKKNKYDSPLLSCISDKGGKSWSTGEAFFGILKEGHLIKVPLNRIDKLLSDENNFFGRLSDAVEFDYWIGHNGIAFIKAKDNKIIMKIERVILYWISKHISPNELEILIHKEFLQDVIM
jgi:exosome complex RNA-binding protein Rrp4